ncbi:MAG: N-acetyl-gamma-glutamyl-phosphate reductase [Thermodesulfobacteriota bacterium]
MSIKAGVLGATGYTGAELLRLLSVHPGVSLEWLTSEKFAGKKIYEVFPHLRGFSDLECRSVAGLKDLGKVDVAFSCLPHGSSMHFTARLLDTGVRVIDFSADFRFREPSVYEKLYGGVHKFKDLLEGAVYGIPELFRDKITNANLVANPGCFAAGVILGLYPLLSENLVDTGSIVADAKAGASGGGRAPSLPHHFPESNENVRVNLSASETQGPEMEDILSLLSRRKVGISFMSHTLSINRGILTTIYSRLRDDATPGYISDIYERYYGGEPFIRIYAGETLPEVKDVRSSNVCAIGFRVKGDRLITVTALDNLVKGASGQAVQNMNLMFGFEETESLRAAGIYP